MATFKQLNLRDHHKLLIPDNIDLSQFLADTIVLIKNQRLTKINQNFDDSIKKIAQYTAQSLTQLQELSDEITPQISDMQSLSDNVRRSKKGSQLSSQYNSVINNVYQKLMNQIDNALRNLITNPIYNTHLPNHYDNVKYRKINRLIDSIESYKDQLIDHPEILKHRLLNENLDPESHLSNPNFLAELTRLHPEYQAVQLVNIQDEFIILEEYDNTTKKSEFSIDYDDMW